MNNLEKFCAVYKKYLTENVLKSPSEYYWYPATPIETVYNKMAAAIAKGSMNKDSKSFKQTCKELGIKHTYAAIKEYINAS